MARTQLQKKHPDLVSNSLLDSSKRRKFVEGQAENALEKKVESLWGRSSKGKIRWPDHWSGLSIRQRAELFGPLYEQEYLEIYSLLSTYAHGGDSGYSGFSEDTLESVYGICLEYARKLYIEALLLCSRAFNLKEGIESFAQVVAFLRNAPDQILIDYGLKRLDNERSSK